MSDGANSHFGHGLYPLCSVGVVSQGERSESGHSVAFHCAGAFALMQAQDADGEKRRCQSVKTLASKLCRRGRETLEYDFEGRSDSDDHSAGEGARWINEAERRSKQSEKGWTVSTVSVETSFRRVNWPNQAILPRSICVQTLAIKV